MSEKPRVGTVGWQDLTVPAYEISTQPVAVAKRPRPFNMLVPGSAEPAAGVCYARAGNADLPPVWILYFVVDDLDRRMRACEEQGGVLLQQPRRAGGGRYCVIKDPAGAVCALYQP